MRGVVMADQVRSLDWEARRAERAGSVAADTLEDVRERLRPVIGL